MRAAEARGRAMPKARDWFWGPLSPLGLGVAAATALLDQAHKAWMLNVYGIRAGDVVTITPFFDLVLVWNRGISYGLLPQESALGRLGLIVFAFAASLALAAWLARVTTPLGAVSIGLIIGGAIGNVIDRIAREAVADFFSLHAFGLQWYVFNIADAAIVAGVAGLLYESLFRGHKKAGKPSKM
jgi:signal peptidase II